MGSLRLISGPTQRPLTLEQVKSHLRVIDDDEDALILTYLDAAIAHAESFMGLALVDQTFDYYIDEFPDGTIALPRAPLLEVLAVEAEGVAFSNYQIDDASRPGRIYLTTGVFWPTTTAVANVGRVRFRAGFIDTTGSPSGEVPSDILSAVLLITGTLYAQRESIIVGTISQVIPWSAEQIMRQHRIELSMA